MPAALIDALDQTLYFLAGAHEGRTILDPALITVPGGKAVLVFSSEARASEHLRALPGGVRVAPVDDLRGKEELFQAALSRGATTLWLDMPVGGMARSSYPLSRALMYILSFKRQSACL